MPLSCSCSCCCVTIRPCPDLEIIYLVLFARNASPSSFTRGSAHRLRPGSHVFSFFIALVPATAVHGSEGSLLSPFPPCCPVCRFHSAPVCDPTRSELNIQPDCVDRGCNSTGCTYRLALPRAPGTTLGWVVWIVFLMRRPHSIRFARAQGVATPETGLSERVEAHVCQLGVPTL